MLHERRPLTITQATEVPRWVHRSTIYASEFLTTRGLTFTCLDPYADPLDRAELGIADEILDYMLTLSQDGVMVYITNTMILLALGGKLSIGKCEFGPTL